MHVLEKFTFLQEKEDLLRLTRRLCCDIINGDNTIVVHYDFTGMFSVRSKMKAFSRKDTMK